jgi:hypothetical protein
VERLAWSYKLFMTDVEALKVQDHMELDALFSEYDMPVRAGIRWIQNSELLMLATLITAYYTQFHGIAPTDVGLRPDGSVRACSVRFHDCISSSNYADDSEHYAPPLTWSRSKSPDQVAICLLLFFFEINE